MNCVWGVPPKEKLASVWMVSPANAGAWITADEGVISEIVISKKAIRDNFWYLISNEKTEMKEQRRIDGTDTNN